MTHSLKWFLCLSVATHAAVLVAWQVPARMPGNTGHTLQLSVTQHSGNRNTQPSAASEVTARAAPDDAAPAVVPETVSTGVKAKVAEIRDSSPRPARRSATEQNRAAAATIMTAAAPATAASHPVIQKEETDRHLRNSVMQLISRELTYPAIARRKGWQGIVKLELHIEADGSITDLQLAETSGYGILDKAAMQCLQYASLPGAARWLRGQTIDIVVPVEYRLVDS